MPMMRGRLNWRPAQCPRGAVKALSWFSWRAARPDAAAQRLAWSRETTAPVIPVATVSSRATISTWEKASPITPPANGNAWPSAIAASAVTPDNSARGHSQKRPPRWALSAVLTRSRAASLMAWVGSADLALAVDGFGEPIRVDLDTPAGAVGNANLAVRDLERWREEAVLPRVVVGPLDGELDVRACVRERAHEVQCEDRDQREVC